MRNEFEQCPLYDKHELDEGQIEQIAERAAKRAVELAKEDLFKDVGHSVFRVMYYLVGVAAVALFVWLVKIGAIKQ